MMVFVQHLNTLHDLTDQQNTPGAELQEYLNANSLQLLSKRNILVRIFSGKRNIVPVVLCVSLVLVLSSCDFQSIIPI